MTLSEIIINGMNNKDCAFFVGTYLGQLTTIRIIIFAGVFYIITKVIDKLALNPFIEFIKKKLYKK